MIASQIVIPAKSGGGGREPGSRKNLIILNFYWIPDSRFAPSGMTGSANRDIVSKGRRDSCGAKLIGVIDIRHSDSNSSVISVVLHCSPFTIHLLLSSSLFPMLYASFATDY